MLGSDLQTIKGFSSDDDVTVDDEACLSSLLHARSVCSVSYAGIYRWIYSGGHLSLHHIHGLLIYYRM